MFQLFSYDILRVNYNKLILTFVGELEGQYEKQEKKC
jgi:hypothetical protein